MLTSVLVIESRFYLRDGADYLCALLAVWMCGAVPVPVNRSQQREILEFVFSQCDSTATLVGEDVDVNTASRRVEWHRTSGSVRDIALTRVKGGDDAMILYTSGTTGRPKGVRHSHHALALNAVEMSAMLQLTDSDRVFLNIPFYYSNSISHLLMTLFNGSCLYASHGFLFGDALIEAVTRSRATGFGGVPAHYVRIADGTKGPIDTDLRFLMNSGDHLPIDVLKALLGIFPGAQIILCVRDLRVRTASMLLRPQAIETKNGFGRPTTPGDRGCRARRGWMPSSGWRAGWNLCEERLLNEGVFS